jgi:hypothetical protein
MLAEWLERWGTASSAPGTKGAAPAGTATACISEWPSEGEPPAFAPSSDWRRLPRAVLIVLLFAAVLSAVVLAFLR